VSVGDWQSNGRVSPCAMTALARLADQFSTGVFMYSSSSLGLDHFVGPISITSIDNMVRVGMPVYDGEDVIII
jgi:hypothetical protein